MNDTSLSNVLDLNNDRHVFFQVKDGSIRHAWFDSSLKTWSTLSNPVVASDARNHTPMSAVLDMDTRFQEKNIVSIRNG